MDKTKILLIDDEKDLVELVRVRLEASKYKVITAYDGTEGLKKAKEEEPDLILLDVMMPGIDGFEVLRRLKSEPETVSIPVIMLTSKGEMRSLFEAERLRATDYIIKPFDAKTLLKFIKRYTI